MLYIAYYYIILYIYKYVLTRIFKECSIYIYIYIYIYVHIYILYIYIYKYIYLSIYLSIYLYIYIYICIYIYHCHKICKNTVFTDLHPAFSRIRTESCKYMGKTSSSFELFLFKTSELLSLSTGITTLLASFI